MDAADLMNKLLSLERAIGVADASQLRNMIMDAQVALLELQRHSLTALQAAIHREAAARPQPRIPDWSEIARAAGRKPPVAEDRADAIERVSPIRVRSLA
jgi:hypothetical protein